VAGLAAFRRSLLVLRLWCGRLILRLWRCQRQTRSHDGGNGKGKDLFFHGASFWKGFSSF
jgi:hypothetical protein